jgi:hypothetical protein
LFTTCHFVIDYGINISDDSSYSVWAWVHMFSYHGLWLVRPSWIIFPLEYWRLISKLPCHVLTCFSFLHRSGYMHSNCFKFMHSHCHGNCSKQHSDSESESYDITYITTNGRPVCLGVKYSSGAYNQIFITVRQLQVCQCGALSLTRRQVCHLWLLLALASAVIFESKSHGTRDHILLSQIRDSLFIASCDLQAYGGGIWPCIHTGFTIWAAFCFSCKSFFKNELQLKFEDSLCKQEWSSNSFGILNSKEWLKLIKY